VFKYQEIYTYKWHLLRPQDFYVFFIYSLFHDVTGSSNYNLYHQMIGSLMNNELEGIWKEVVGAEVKELCRRLPGGTE
jgi:hypothetical protein